MAARVKSQAGGTDDGAALSIPSAFRNHLMLGATEAIMWIACRRHFSHEMIREHLERRGLNQRRRLHSGHVNCALQRRADKAQLDLVRLIIGGVPASGTLDDEGHRDHKKRVPLPVEFLKDGAYIELLSGHIRADPLLEKHSGYQRRTYRDVEIDRDAFFKALAAAEPRSQATDDKPIELADASFATDTPNPEVLTEAHKAEPPPKPTPDSQQAAPEAAGNLTPKPSDKVTKPAHGRGRKKGTGTYTKKDKPLVAEMERLIAEDDLSDYAAAKKVAKHATGGGSEESKAKRLVGRYREQHN